MGRATLNGYGGPWGGQALDLSAQLEGGFGGYLEPEGSQAIWPFGITLTPKVALGLQRGPVGVEVGPTWRTRVPLLTSVHNSDAWSGTATSASIDIEFPFGGGAGPHRWY